MHLPATLKKDLQRAASFSVLFIWVISSLAQKTELTISANSGLFSFAGLSSDNSSTLLIPNASPAYTLNPYGSKNGFSYGLSAEIQRISKRNIIAGLDAGYELLKSKLDITIVAENLYSSNSSSYHRAKGHTFIYNNFINIFPYIGKRFIKNKMLFDLATGLEAGYCLKSTEKAYATIENGTRYTTSLDRETITTDVRPRIQLSGHYKRSGILIGYSYSLSNYKAGYIGGKNQCYSRLFRFGLTHKIH